MPNTSGLRRKIWVAFILQMTAISFAAVLGVYAAATVIEDVLVKRILQHDAEYFLDRAAKDPATAPPDTYFVRGYLVRPGADPSVVPDALRDFDPGYHQGGVGRSDVVYVTDSPSGRLYLSLDATRTHHLVLAFGLALCGIIVVIVYFTTWMTYRASRSALSPVIALANAVRDWDPKHPDLDALLPENLPVRADGDVESLAYALHGFATRLEEFVERERAFTRDASHELRTPLTVIKGSADMLLDDEEAPPFARRTADRILRAVRDMESLIESFLILARESDTGLPEVEFSVNDAVFEEIERAQPLCEGKPVHIVREERSRLALRSSPRAFRVLVGNLIRNACQYTEKGRVTIVVERDRVVVRDTGVGLSEEEQKRAFVSFFRGDQGRGSGHGIGLTIVKRLADRFGWEVGMASEEGIGTTVTVTFPETQRL
ncbi:MAG TPA: HAMP domain-containing sensor histidine kinase [Rhodanobacteraceae bacterium]|nr:HAMP domain-containing sensor histidine kinase [Rhodanobacteraceae bacterium]